MNEELILELMTSLKVSRERAENLVEWYLVKELEKHRTWEALRNSCNTFPESNSTKLWNKLRRR